MEKDKYYVYRSLLDLIGFTEGTDKGGGYNETLAYGKMLDGKATKGKGPSIVLTDKTLDQIDAIQTRMLADPDNKALRSSALGRYQFVRTTLRAIRQTLGLTGGERFDRDMQDRLGCYLLGVRGIDKYLSGRLSEDTLINNLAQEWASLPTTAGKGYYAGQHTPITVARMRETLAQVKRRHLEGQPVKLVNRDVPVPVPVIPKEVEKEVRKNTNWLSGGLFGSFTFGGFGAWLAGMNWQALLLVAGIGAVVILAVLLFGEWGVRRVRSIRTALEE